MARYNSVPLGQAGTGSAFILPESRALQGLMQNIDYNRKMGLLNIQAKRDAALQTNKDFQDNQIKAKGGILFQPEIDAAMQDWTRQGAELRMKGINPWNPNTNDPDQIKAATEFTNRKAEIEGMAQTRDIYQENFLKQRSEYEKGGYDDDSWGAFNEFYSKNKLSDLYKGGILPPTLTKAFDHTDFMKNVSDATQERNTIKNGIETTELLPNEDKIRFSIESNLSNSPQAQRHYKKVWGVDENAAPLKTLMRTTDPEEITQTLDQYYKTDKAGIQEALKAFPSGQVPSYTSPEYQSFVNDQAKKQLEQEKRYDAGLDALAQEKISGVDTKKKIGYNFGAEDQAMQRESNARAREGNERARVNFANSQKDRQDKIVDRKLKSEPANQRDKFIQGIQIGNKEQMSSLRQLAKSKGGRVSYTENGLLRLTYNKSVGGQVVTQTKDVDLSDQAGNGYTHLNEVLTDLTGKKIDIEKLNGTAKYEGPMVRTETRDFNSEEVKYLRDAFPSMEDLGSFLYKKGMIKTQKDAFKAAAEILDPKGRDHTIVFKKK